LNIWAPGKEVNSAWIGDKDDPTATDNYEWLSGTSMAAPHVAGVMAIIMSYEGYQTLSAQNVYDRLVTNAINTVNAGDELTSSLTTLMLLQSGINEGTLSTWSRPHAGVLHDEFKLAVAASETSNPNPSGIAVDRKLSEYSCHH